MTSRLAAPLLLAAALAACKTEVVCTTAQATCDGQCTSLASDPSNCGACGRACATGESCAAGLCCQGDQCPPAVLAACFNGSAVQGATAGVSPVGAPVLVESGPISLAWRGTSLWVANSISNTIDRMKVSPAGLASDGTFPTIRVPVSGPFSDLEALAEWNGLLYVSNAAVGSLLVIDPAAVLPIVAEISLPASSFPQGIAFTGNKGYVALNGSNAIAVVDLAARAVTRTIDLSTLASPGALAMPSRLVASGSRLFVTLWNLDSTYAPAGNGRLAVIDTTTDTLEPIVNPVDLGTSCLDPGGLALAGDTLWVTCGFFPYDAASAADIRGAAFVPVALGAGSPIVGTAIPATGFAPGAIAFCNGMGYVGDRFSGNVLRFDPSARAVTAQGLVCAPTATGSSFVADVACGR
jgi:hypothetical protein